MYEGNEARMQATYAQARMNFLGQRVGETSCPYLSLLINEVSANELKNKVCILEMEMFKENDWILKDITLTICSVFMCSAFIFY